MESVCCNPLDQSKSPETPKTFSCPTCGGVFASQNLLFKHQRENHLFPPTPKATKSSEPPFAQPTFVAQPSSSTPPQDEVEELDFSGEELESTERAGESLNQGLEFHVVCNVTQNQWAE